MQINWINLLTGGSAVLLVGTDVAVLAEAAAWAASRVAGLAPQIALVLYLLAGLVALVTTIVFARMVHEVEPFFEAERTDIDAHTGVAAGRGGER